ncbi:hypothetical protein IMY05_002G0059700 [Salix suchowensis]|nr:hypothetical protein IMY05_002G0059700 [Salix suchowensis]
MNDFPGKISIILFGTLIRNHTPSCDRHSLRKTKTAGSCPSGTANIRRAVGILQLMVTVYLAADSWVT